MSNPLDKHINDKLSKKDYSFDQSNWDSYQAYQTEFLSLDKILNQKEYVAKDADWKAFKKYQYLNENRRRIILLLGLFLCILFGAVYFSLVDFENNASIDNVIVSKDAATKNAQDKKTASSIAQSTERSIDSNTKSASNSIKKSEASKKENKLNTKRSKESKPDQAIVTTTILKPSIEEVIDFSSVRQTSNTESVSNAHKKQSIEKSLDNKSTFSSNSNLSEDKNETIKRNQRTISHSSLSLIDVLLSNLNIKEREEPILNDLPNILPVKLQPIKKKPLVLELTAGSLFNEKRQMYFGGVGLEKRIASKWSVGLNILGGYVNLDDKLLASRNVNEFSFGVQASSQQLVLQSVVDLRMALKLAYDLLDGLQLYGHLTPNYVLGAKASRQNINEDVVAEETKIWILKEYEPKNEIFYGIGIRKEILRRSFLSAGVSSSSGVDSKLLYSLQLTQQF